MSEASASAYESALRILARGRQTAHTLRTKLKLKRFGEKAIDDVLLRLESNGLINDKEFASMFIEDCLLRRPFGKHRIFQELKSKGIQPSLIEKTLEVVSREDEFAMGKLLAEKKMRLLTDEDPRMRKKKICDMLMRKGFKFSTIEDILHINYENE